MTKAEELIKILNLQEHPVEGGFFRESYRSAGRISRENLGLPYEGDRSFSTAILYMLVPGAFSEMHRLKGDEIFHFYLGSPVEMLQLLPDGSGKRVIIGSDIIRGETPQLVVPAGVWQGTRLLPGGEFALLGTTMSPGFDYSDYEPGKRAELIRDYPHFKDSIILLTKSPGMAALS